MAFWAGLIIWIIAPIAAIGVLMIQDRTATLSAVTPAWSPVRSASLAVTQDVSVALRWSAGTQVVAPAWSGTVQSVKLQTGRKVSDGSAIAVIDGITRICWLTPGAFYRQLGLDDSGPDVGWLNDALRKRGASISSRDVFGYDTLAAVRALAQSLGVKGASRVASFDPDWIVYLPAQINSATSVGLIAGQPAPSAGTALAAGAPQLEDATVVKSSQASSDDSDANLTASQRASAYEATVRSDSVSTPSSAVLRYAGTPLKLDSAHGHLSETAVRLLRSTVTTNTSAVPATLTTSQGVDAVVVPAASVTAGSRATVCVQRGKSVEEVVVSVVGGQDDQTRVQGEVRSGEHVRVPGPSSSLPCR